MVDRRHIRETLEIEVKGETVSLDIDWRVIEIVERTFGSVADLVVSDTLVNSPTRYQIADVISEWVKSRDMPKSQVREAVMLASQELLNEYIGAIQGAVLYSLNYITEEQLDKLTSGDDLEGEESEGSEDEQENPT